MQIIMSSIKREKKKAMNNKMIREKKRERKLQDFKLKKFFQMFYNIMIFL